MLAPVPGPEGQDSSTWHEARPENPAEHLRRADAFARGFTCAAVIAAVVAAYALWRMPAQRVTGAIGHMHH